MHTSLCRTEEIEIYWADRLGRMDGSYLEGRKKFFQFVLVMARNGMDETRSVRVEDLQSVGSGVSDSVDADDGAELVHRPARHDADGHVRHAGQIGEDAPSFLGQDGQVRMAHDGRESSVVVEEQIELPRLGDVVAEVRLVIFQRICQAVLVLHRADAAARRQGRRRNGAIHQAHLLQETGHPVVHVAGRLAIPQLPHPPTSFLFGRGTEETNDITADGSF